MPYVERITRAGKTIEVDRYFTSQYKKKGIKKGDRVKPTKEEQKKIFSHFIKLDREMQGTGLGLTLSQTIIQNLGGNLELDSEINRGSTFSFVLPQVVKPELIKAQVIK